MKSVINILVPIDFSVCSENAFVYAIQLADKIKANILLLHVPILDSVGMSNPLSMPFIIEEGMNQAKIRMDESIEKASKSLQSSLDEKPSIQTHTEIGKVEATICDVAARNQISYIVMGTQGKNSTLNKYLGSVASNVLKNAPCPVLVIPENTEFPHKMELGYATDFSDTDPYEIWRTAKLFQAFQPNIKCVHFSEKPVQGVDEIKELETYLAETAPDLNIAFYNLPLKDKVKDMNGFVEKHDINMLVMCKPKRTFFESIFHKSYTQKMTLHTHIPLLVLKERKL